MARHDRAQTRQPRRAQVRAADWDAMSWDYTPCPKCSATHVARDGLDRRGSDESPPCYSVPVSVQYVDPPELGFDVAMLDAETLDGVT